MPKLGELNGSRLGFTAARLLLSDTEAVRKEVNMSGKTMACLDGAIAGLIGASIVAVSFLFIDTVTHLPLYTPTVLGEGLFLREQSFAPKTGERVSLELTLMYSGVHGLVFIALGMIAAFFL